MAFEPSLMGKELQQVSGCEPQNLEVLVKDAHRLHELPESPQVWNRQTSQWTTSRMGQHSQPNVSC